MTITGGVITSALQKLVGGIFQIIPSPQMRRVDARWIVAFMQNLMVIIADDAASIAKRNTMRFEQSFLKKERAVSLFAPPSHPNPTPV